MIAAALGGRVAEEVIFGEITTGAGNDIEQATNIARTMVTRYGMSDKLGPRTFGLREELVFLGKELNEQRDYSNSVAEDIDDEVRVIINTAYEKAVFLVSEHRNKLKELAEYLIENETIEGEVLTNLLDSHSPEQPPDVLPAPAPAD